MNSSMSLENYLFGPLDKRYCLLFYIFTVLMFFVFVVGLFGFVFQLFRNKKLNSTDMMFMVYSLFATFISYLTYRLLYSMCLSSNLSETA